MEFLNLNLSQDISFKLTKGKSDTLTWSGCKDIRQKTWRGKKKKNEQPPQNTTEEQPLPNPTKLINENCSY